MSTEQSNAYDVVLSDLDAQIERLTIARDALRQIKDLGIPFAATAAVLALKPNSRPSAPAAAIPHDAFYGMTIPDAARKYLGWGGNRNTKSNPELCEALLGGGFQTNAANFGESVRATLTRHPDFAKINGQWGLAEWYGNRGSKKAKRNTAENSRAEKEPPDGEDVSVEEPGSGAA